MKEHILNLRFESLKECQEWEAAHIINNKYEGECVFMVNHESEMGSDWVVLVSIFTV